MSGRKDDDAKVDYSLVDPWALEEMVKGLTYGKKKYGANNWRQVESWEDRYFAAAQRHLAAHRRGELVDPESGIPHLALAACSLHFLLAKVLEKSREGEKNSV